MTETTNDAGEQVRPWQKEPFVWMLISFPLAAVVGGFVTLYLAIVSYDGLIVDDYYKRGLEINRVLDREQQAQAFGLNMTVKLDQQNGAVEIRLDAEKAIEFPLTLMGSLTNNTRPGLDQELLFKQQSDKVYRASSQPLATGRWHLIVGNEVWRSIKRVSVTADGRVSVYD